MIEFACIQGKEHMWVPQLDGYRFWTSNGTAYDPGANGSIVMQRFKCAMCNMEKHEPSHDDISRSET